LPLKARLAINGRIKTGFKVQDIKGRCNFQAAAGGLYSKITKKPQNVHERLKKRIAGRNVS
jgi:hypothetical protein